MINVANKTFKTKKQLECFTRDFLTENDGKEIVIGQYGYKFLCDLIGRHPERPRKVSGVINRFKIHRNMGGHIALSFIDEEGEKSIGWRKCVSQKQDTWLSNIKEVCRQEITSQVQSYKDLHYYDDMPCPLCLRPIPTRKQAQVDHKTIPFREIFKSFIDEYNQFLPKEFQSAGNHLSYVFRDDDRLIAELWKHYHSKRADYQILCADCNVAKK